MTSTLATLRDRLQPRVRQRLAIDARSAAALRAIVALLLLIDLGTHLGLLSTFYSDGGLLPRGALLGDAARWRLSLHAAGGQIAFEWGLWLIAVAAAAGLLAGWRTRWSGIVSAVLYVSLLNRAPALVTSGERLLAILLVWGCLLPWGRAWSLDAARADAAVSRGDNLAAAGLKLQVALAITGITLLALSQTWLAQWLVAALPALRPHPSLTDSVAVVLRAGTALMPWVLIASPWHRPRRIALLLLVLLALAFVIYAPGQLLSWILAAMLLVFVDDDWSRLPRSRVLRLYHDADRPGDLRWQQMGCLFLGLGEVRYAAAQSEPRTATLLRANASWIVIDADDRAHMRWAAVVALTRQSPLLRPLASLLAPGPVRAIGDRLYALLHRLPSPRAKRMAVQDRSQSHPLVPGVLLALVLASNLAALGLMPGTCHAAFDAPLRLLRLEQQWSRYAPPPPRHETLVVAASHGDGSVTDLLNDGQPLDWHRAAEPGEATSTALRRFLSTAQGDGRFARYARWACRQHPDIVRLRIVALAPSSADGGTAEQRPLWREDCAHPDEPVPGDE